MLELNDCTNPVKATEPAANLPQVQLRQSAFLRPFRSAFLTLRNDFTRGNLAYQAYSGIRLGLDVMRPGKTAADEPRTIRYGGQEFAVVAGAAPPPKHDFLKDPGHRVHHESRKHQPRSYANRLMFSASGGLAGYGNPRFSTLPMYLALIDESGNELLRDPIPLEITLERGWTISPKVTLNSWKYVSNEFAYTRTITNFRVFGRDQLLGNSLDERSKAAIRQFSYNALFHLRPNGSRFRPYVAVGPAFQLIHLLEAQPQKGGLLKLAARDVALFVSAYNFGSKPPLEGGGIFQPGLNFGGGASIHLTPRVFLRADFRETLSAQPDFWKSSAAKLAEQSSTDQFRLVAQPLVKHGPLRFQVVTLGIGFSF